MPRERSFILKVSTKPYNNSSIIDELDLIPLHVQLFCIYGEFLQALKFECLFYSCKSGDETSRDWDKAWSSFRNKGKKSAMRKTDEIVLFWKITSL